MGGAGYIPWSKAMLYASHVGIDDPDERERFWRMMNALDSVYLEWLNEKQKTDSKPKP